jgi:hypothetical protein
MCFMVELHTAAIMCEGDACRNRCSRNAPVRSQLRRWFAVGGGLHTNEPMRPSSQSNSICSAFKASNSPPAGQIRPVQDGDAPLHSAGAKRGLCGCSTGGRACMPQGTTLPLHDTVAVDELQLNGCACYMDTPC